MWKPDNVVPEHKRRAKVIWGALLLAIVGYTILQIWDLIREFDNPNTTFSVSDDSYAFPLVTVCFTEGSGCDTENLGTACMGSAASAVYDSCLLDTGISGNVIENTNCMEVDLSTLDLASAAECNTISNKPSTTVEIVWIASLAPDDEDGFSESVGVILGDDESAQEYVEVPYSRVVSTPGSTPDDVTFTDSDLTIGRTIRNFNRGDSTTRYPVLSTSTNTYVNQDPIDPSSSSYTSSSYAIGYLYLTISQGAYSATELSDVYPFDIPSLLGNIGGFWELLLVGWAICFVASMAQSPTEKGRDFTQPVKRGKEIVGRKRRKNRTQTMTPDSEDGGEEQPYWSAAGRGLQEVPDGSILVVPPPAGAGPSSNVDASSRRPIPQEGPMRLVDNSSRSIITVDGFMADGDEESNSQQNKPPV